MSQSPSRSRSNHPDHNHHQDLYHSSHSCILSSRFFFSSESIPISFFNHKVSSSSSVLVSLWNIWTANLSQLCCFPASSTSTQVSGSAKEWHHLRYALHAPLLSRIRHLCCIVSNSLWNSKLFWAVLFWDLCPPNNYLEVTFSETKSSVFVECEGSSLRDGLYQRLWHAIKTLGKDFTAKITTFMFPAIHLKCWFIKKPYFRKSVLIYFLCNHLEFIVQLLNQSMANLTLTGACSTLL